ncbi:MAG: glycosyltransferase [Halobacteriales archaeon]|nr:glycosyltransferase [Halobacteriales archaeon]
MEAVAAFTDTYLPTVNGVTYTVTTWRDRWRARGGEMAVVYPRADGHDAGPGEHGVRSLPFPFYEGFRIGLPRLPRGLADVDLVHVHTPFSMGVAGWRLSRRLDVPLVASYHTPTNEYVGYLTSQPTLERGLDAVSRGWERRFYDRAALVTAPSEPSRDHLVDAIGVDTRVEVVPNGVDTERFGPVDTRAFRERHGLGDGPLVGYTGRHGHEKRLDVLIEAAPGIDATVVLAGDGPARDALERRAAELDADVRFLGFLDRDELSAFYASLDVFAFPSPVETQGIVALEAIACGTPVVGADRGALEATIDDGETGYHFAAGDADDLATTVGRALAEQAALTASCVDRRPSLDVEMAVDRLASLYAEL